MKGLPTAQRPPSPLATALASPPPPPLSFRAQPRDLRFYGPFVEMFLTGDEKRLGPATTLHGTVALSFVIPSEAEGSAVLRTPRGNTEPSLHPIHPACALV